jgi:hypothetical protein
VLKVRKLLSASRLQVQQSSIEFNVNSSIDELQSKSELDIERDTAMRWGSRSAGAYVLAELSDDPEDRERWLLAAERYRHESIHHAVLVDDEPNLVKQICVKLEEYRFRVLF